MRDDQWLRIRLIEIDTSGEPLTPATAFTLCEKRSDGVYSRSLAMPHNAKYLPERTITLERVMSIVQWLESAALYKS